MAGLDLLVTNPSGTTLAPMDRADGALWLCESSLCSSIMREQGLQDATCFLLSVPSSGAPQCEPDVPNRVLTSLLSRVLFILPSPSFPALTHKADSRHHSSSPPTPLRHLYFKQREVLPFLYRQKLSPLPRSGISSGCVLVL